MREVERTSRFRRDFKREAEGQHRSILNESVVAVLRLLVADAPLPERYRDHAMAGDWSGYRDCHGKPDLVLIYEKPETTTLRLIRLGSHSALGLRPKALPAFRPTPMASSSRWPGPIPPDARPSPPGEAAFRDRSARFFVSGIRGAGGIPAEIA